MYWLKEKYIERDISQELRFFSMNSTRWSNYRKANDLHPEVRAKELNLMVETVDPSKEQVIIECGTGNGYLTFPLAKRLGNKGKLITYDIIEENLKSVNERNKNLKYPIQTEKQKLSYSFDLPDNYADKIVSIATFHHYDNITEKTGISGRTKALTEFHRVLKKGGKVILADVEEETISAKYFRSINSPTYCSPNGHPHAFLSLKEIRDLCAKIGFKIESLTIEKVPWTFSSKVEAAKFLCTIHNAQCSPQESFEHAQKTLTFWQEGEFFYLEWELFYLVASKI